ncbi:MAG: hypothetical protein J6S76_05390 [Clostridia bacterium]|nr:hypothetical protein [Clostridia bacterium]
MSAEQTHTPYTENDSPPQDPRPMVPPEEDSAVGTLIISAGTGGRAYPLPGVRAEIFIDNGTGTEELYAVRETGESGIAPPLAVPAPDASLSETPGAAVLPYTVVRIRAYLQGYAPQEALRVPVFAGIRSLQYFEMIPLPSSGQYEAPPGIFTIVADGEGANL